MASTRPRRFDLAEQTSTKNQIEPSEQTRCAYITFITQASYLPGTVMLAHSLREHGSQHPLIVLYTPKTLVVEALEVLQSEAAYSKLLIYPVEHLVPHKDINLNVAVERFKETWTKLRVFEAYNLPFDILCYLDADMLLFDNMDSIFTITADLPDDWVAAVHDCVCNTGTRAAWTPEDHIPENCAFTAYTTTPSQPGPYDGGTYHLFNSGMFVFRPNAALWNAIRHFFDTTDLLPKFAFPDQQFMTHFFHQKWQAVSWRHNAVKTMDYRHSDIWRDDEVICLHYVNDKPWSKRNEVNGSAGLRGKDGKSHGWWWSAYRAWQQVRWAQGCGDVLNVVARYVAPPAERSHPVERTLSTVIDYSMGLQITTNLQPKDEERRRDSHLEDDG